MGAVRQIGMTVVSLGVAALLCVVMAACGGSKTMDAGAAVKLEIVAPADGGSVRVDRVTVRGTVAPSDATVQILGRSVQVGNGIFAGSVPLHRGANTVDVVASAAGSAPATATITVTRVGPGAPRTKRIRARGAPPLSNARNCGGGLTAGAHTSCAFAENVRAASESSGSGVLDVYSPTTGQTYRMYCTSGSPHVCTGGNGASVYFSSGGSATGYGLSRCAADLVVGPNTSCAFARNAQAEYYRSGAGWISVYSPVTNRSYNMYCTGTSPHVCAGGNDAAVYFP
jgi:hypothetical protein